MKGEKPHHILSMELQGQSSHGHDIFFSTQQTRPEMRRSETKSTTDRTRRGKKYQNSSKEKLDSVKAIKPFRSVVHNRNKRIMIQHDTTRAK